MYALDAPQSLITHRDLRANDIHVSTMFGNDEEALELMRGQSLLATAIAGAEGLYEIVIKAISPTLRVKEKISQVAREGGPGAIANNLAQTYLTASTSLDIWHKMFGHPRKIVFKRMNHLLTGHNLTPVDANKLAPCEACIQ